MLLHEQTDNAESRKKDHYRLSENGGKEMNLF